MTHVTVERENGDLEKQEWRFWYYESGHALVLDYYYLIKRATKRHGWKIETHYSRLDGRSSHLTLDETPLPDDVKEEAREKFNGALQVGT